MKKIENIEDILNKIQYTSVPLFKSDHPDNDYAIFDDKGFFLSNQAEEIYKKIKDKPHIYIAYGNDWYYVGKSNQKGGRWKRAHYYHLGGLAHEINNSIRSDEQRHHHWVDAWMDKNEILKIDNLKKIRLHSRVYIKFLEFNEYADVIDGINVRELNTRKEKEIINILRKQNCKLLNIQNNK